MADILGNIFKPEAALSPPSGGGTIDFMVVAKNAVDSAGFVSLLWQVSDGGEGLLDGDSGGDSVAPALAVLDRVYEMYNAQVNLFFNDIPPALDGVTESNANEAWTAYVALFADVDSAYAALGADVGGDQVATAIGLIASAVATFQAFIA